MTDSVDNSGACDALGTEHTGTVSFPAQCVARPLPWYGANVNRA